MKMTELQKQITELTSEVKKLEENASSASISAYNLRTERDNLFAKMVIEEKLLDNTEWELFDSPKQGGGFRLEYLAVIPQSMKFIRDLVGEEYWFNIGDDIRFVFDEGSMTLSFKESKQVMQFAKKNGLKIMASGIKNKISQLKREVAGLETICHYFNL